MGEGEFRKHTLQRRGGAIALHALALLGIGLIGLGLGFAVGWWPMRQAGSAQPTYATPIATRAPSVIAAATPLPVRAPTLAATAAPTAATIASTIGPIGSERAIAGAWRITEANAEIGTMIWSGSRAPSSGSTIILELHKVAVAGQPATACERATKLQAQIAADIAQQIVPFRETNCAGTTSTGTLHVDRFAAGGRAFDGTFAENGVLLGHFTASEL